MSKVLLWRVLRALHPRNWLYCRPPIDAVYVVGYKARWYVPRDRNEDGGGENGGGHGPDGPQNPDPISPTDFDRQLGDLIASQRVPA